MTYHITILPSAGRQIAALPRQIQHRIQSKIDSLAEVPRPPGAKALHGTKGYIRLRVGEFRIIYRVEDKRLLILIVSVAHRREAYRNLP